MKTKDIRIGDRVQLTGKFLRSTGQYTGSEASSVWTVTGFSGSSLCIVDEPLHESVLVLWTAEELTADPTLRFRRIAKGNLRVVK